MKCNVLYLFSKPNRVVISTILYAPKYTDNSLSENLNMREKVIIN